MGVIMAKMWTVDKTVIMTVIMRMDKTMGGDTIALE